MFILNRKHKFVGNKGINSSDAWLYRKKRAGKHALYLEKERHLIALCDFSNYRLPGFYVGS